MQNMKPLIMNPILMGQMNSIGLNPMQLQAMQMMQLNNQMNQMKLAQNQMTKIQQNPMLINQFNQINQTNQFNQVNQVNPMQINQINQIKQLGQMSQMPQRIPISVPSQYIAQGIPIVPVPPPMIYPNPLYMQIYQQNLMQEKEVQRLNQNYEYQLKKHKESELYKVVNDKKNNNNNQ